MYGEKIKIIRELRGFTQGYMASKLGIAQNTYSKIETNQMKLTADMLNRISNELGVSPIDILSSQPIIIQNHSSNQGAQGNIENFYADQKDLYERIIISKDEEINNLTEVIMSLKEVISSISKKV